MTVSFNDSAFSTYVEGFDRVMGFFGELPPFSDARIAEVAIRKTRGQRSGERTYVDLTLMIYRNNYADSAVALRLRFWDSSNVSIALTDELNVDLFDITVEELEEPTPHLQEDGLRCLRVALA